MIYGRDVPIVIWVNGQYVQVTNEMIRIYNKCYI